MKVKKLTLTSTGFPEYLKNIPNPPKQLYVLGDIEAIVGKPRLAVVGSRKVTPYGHQVTADLVGQVARRGVVIISGLALGLDGLAHRAALDNGALTVAVLPCGLDRFYPSSHFHLAKEILAKGGVLISEYPEGTEPFKDHFIARNRLVSGLSDAVLIPEAAAKSGTMHTANFALDQGKIVMAVPGNISNPMSQGANNLLKSGAVMVTEAKDILLALNLEGQMVMHEVLGETKEEADILEMLAAGMTDASLLLAASGMDAPTFNQTLTMLEISCKIRPLGAGHWGLK